MALKEYIKMRVRFIARVLFSKACDLGDAGDCDQYAKHKNGLQ
jgi:hypothetical protein